MKTRREVLIFPLLILLFGCGLLTGCGPKVDVSPRLTEVQPTSLALLPNDSIDTIPRERVEYLRELLRLDLKEKGFSLLDDAAVAAICGNAACESRSELQERYGVVLFGELSLESISRVNFIAGYVNALSGTFRVRDAAGEVLYQAEHTERDSGGVILESGQLIQAVINQARSGEEGAIDSLSYRFVDSLLDDLPQVEDLNQQREILQVERVEVTPFVAAHSQVCAWATPGNSAWLVSAARARSELREIERGKYCGVFRLTGPWSREQGIQVEIRSVFGETVRQVIMNTVTPTQVVRSSSESSI